ncbi:prenyltransferase [Pseudodesulfovibrio sp. JC047]|uniref:prenyltransferase n=1 Tax=Pseudodesulfovibrio sp. JC047 TaxID=2683199 RepID=UPI0013D0D574|nr:prenyltransferase [Pseudodesulfovibrio sp. JC047]NDV18603.1 prenyltransferase [Pseudodesulfovibrio sp. JC047]
MVALSTPFSWLKAARIPSQTYIFLPLLLGEIIALSTGQPFDVWTVVLVHLFGLTIQLYIVFANDYADQETDRRNITFTPFSGGSRVLVDGDLHPHAILTAARLMAICSIVIGSGLSVRGETIFPVLLAAAGVVLLWMYSYPPIKLSYRGGGELLQMIGVGVVLPLMGYSAMTQGIHHFSWEFLKVILPTQLACAIGTAVPDEPSDRIGQKRTIPVLLGPIASRILVIALHSLTAAQLIGLFPPTSAHLFAWFSIIFLTASILGQLFFITNKPGSSGVLIFTLLSILSTLTSMTILCLHDWL